MANWPFRFLHASDFHLETPPSGLTDVPEHLKDLLLEAPYLAAERVFETALAEQVDFVVLAGDLVECREAGPRAIVFLIEQFSRLAERHIAVYWSGGRVDPPSDWPASIRLPDSVHVFAEGAPQERIFRRDDSPVARIMGASRADHGRIAPAGFEPAQAGLFTLALAHGHADLDALRAGRVDYWALGDRHARTTLAEAMPVVHYPGSPQGRRPEETGPHGCTLVTVDAQRNVRMTPVTTDAFRWLDERIEVDGQTTRETLETTLDGRAAEMARAAGGMDQLVTWTIRGTGPLVRQLRRAGLAETLLERLRQNHGHGRPALWSVSLAAEQDTPVPASWFKQETIRGDFLRGVAQRAENSDESLGIERLVPEGELARAAAWLPEGKARQSVLREAALLGADLLSGEEPDS